jgi:DNA-binding CsgD family transcriptional regulator
MDVPELTERQRQCLYGFLERKTAKQIGRELGISHHAVEQHMKAARRKLGAQDSAAAARLYFGNGHTTVEQYYGPSEVSVSQAADATMSDPERFTFLLRDIATDKSGTTQSLSARQTLLAIGLCGIGMIVILSLIVAVADGVAQLAH